MQQPTMTEAVQETLRCPVCRGRLDAKDEQLICAGCEGRFPKVNGVPVLLNEEASVFSVDDFLSRQSTTFIPPRRRIEKVLLRPVPRINEDRRSKQNYEKLVGLLLARSATPRVLVVGGSVLGQGMEPLASSHSLELVETDVSFGPRTMLICDAHDLPFADESFDGVVAQAVLEHVVDPYRCVEEIHRVLKNEGLVYAETPFMAQVHMGRYDFTRFTHLGHRRLFRKFEEIDSGAASGPGVALAWSYRYFLLSFANSRSSRGLARAFASLTSFYLKYFDRYLIKKPAALDAAFALYFMGKKGSHTLSDRELIKLYRGQSSIGHST